MNLHDKAQKIRWIVLDVDGVLTDGGIGYGGTEDEIKFFNVRDGHGLTLAKRAGLKTAILSGRGSKANRTRMAELHFDKVVEKCHDKKTGLLELAREVGAEPEEMMYIGDDVVDAPPIKAAGIGVVVGDGAPELDAVASFRTRACGGHGAVREALEWLLKEQGKWQELMQRYFD